MLDYQIKRELYLSHGIPEYWIANADARIVSRWRGLDDPGEVFSKRIEWHRPACPPRLSSTCPSCSSTRWRSRSVQAQKLNYLSRQ